MVNTNQVEYLIETNIFLVYKIARRFNVNPFDREDLIQAGLYGLYKAATRYDITRGNKFSTFAVYYIIGAMKDELRKASFIKRNNIKDDIVLELKEDLNDIKSHYLNLDKFCFDEDELKVLSLRLEYGLTQKAIACKLGFSQSKVSRILKNLKEKIKNNKNSIYN